MKMLLFGLVAGVVTFGMAACSDSGNQWDNVCESMWAREFKLDSNLLSSDKLSQLEDVYVDGCVDVLSDLPKCEDEYYAYTKCIYLDHSEDYWEKAEAKCFEDHDTLGEIGDCVDNIYLECGPIEETASCEAAAAEEVEAYLQSSIKSIYTKLGEKLAEWGIQLPNLDDDDGDDDY